MFTVHVALHSPAGENKKLVYAHVKVDLLSSVHVLEKWQQPYVTYLLCTL